MADEAQKKARLAEALRANLRKRKAQAREQSAAGDAGAATREDGAAAK